MLRRRSALAGVFLCFLCLLAVSETRPPRCSEDIATRVSKLIHDAPKKVAVKHSAEPDSSSFCSASHSCLIIYETNLLLIVVEGVKRFYFYLLFLDLKTVSVLS